MSAYTRTKSKIECLVDENIQLNLEKIDDCKPYTDTQPIEQVEEIENVHMYGIDISFVGRESNITYASSRYFEEKIIQLVY